MKKVLASYWFPSLLGVLPTVFWAPSELSFMLIFCFSPLLIWLYRKEKLREIFIGTYLFFLVFDLISLRWLWQVEFSVKGWVIAIIALILLPALQSIPIFLGMALSKRLNLIYVLGSIPVIAVMFDYICRSFSWISLVEPCARFGFITSKTHGGAVRRNIGIDILPLLIQCWGGPHLHPS